MPGTGGDGLASVAETLAGLTATACAGSLDDTAALTALAATRQIATELEHSELALIEAARDAGATWTRIAVALGARNRQTAQKRHTDLARRCPRPPSVDTPTVQPGPRVPEGNLPEAKTLVSSEGALPESTKRPSAGAGEAGEPVSRAREHVRLPPAAAQPATARRRPAVPRVTSAIIAEGRYELVRAPDHAETRAWHVLVGGRLAGLVRPTWRGERSRPGWEPVGTAGNALPATGIGRVTPAGNARTRDAAAVSLLRALQRQQETEGKNAARDPTSTHTARDAQRSLTPARASRPKSEVRTPPRTPATRRREVQQDASQTCHVADDDALTAQAGDDVPAATGTS